MASKERRWVRAPQPSPQGSSEAPGIRIKGVRLDQDEDVQWIWTHTSTGSYVSGYNIIKIKADTIKNT